MKSVIFALINFGPISAVLVWILSPWVQVELSGAFPLSEGYIATILLIVIIFISLSARTVGLKLPSRYRAKYIYFISSILTFVLALRIGLMFFGFSMVSADGGLSGFTLYSSIALATLFPFGIFFIIYISPWFFISSRLTMRLDPEFCLVLPKYKSFSLKRATLPK